MPSAAALAIADDIGAVLVIAVIYTPQVDWRWLGLALVPLAALVAMNWARVEEPVAYFAVAALLWFAFLSSGVHATIAGVIAAFTIPSVARITPLELTRACRVRLADIESIEVPGAHTLEDDRQQRYALDLQRASLKSIAPLQRIEWALHPFTTFVVLPVFALANAGIPLGGADPASAVSLGIVFGLVAGKPAGIALLSWLPARAGLADLPAGVGWRHVLGAGALAGIGFTMSLFVSNLAFASEALAAQAKGAIFAASIASGIVGYAILRWWAPAGEARG